MSSSLSPPYSSIPLPIDGLDGWRSIVVALAFVVVVLVLCWTVLLAVLAERWSSAIAAGDRFDARYGVPFAASEQAWWWVFLVPALNEERTIADSIGRLRAVKATNRLIIVIDDASDDATPRILEQLAGDDLVVIRRELPGARLGKANALDLAWRQLRQVLAKRDIPRDRVITCVVDADGRLAPNAPSRAARLFLDERIGGIQVLVRIYNDHGLLTRAQDLEFRIIGWLFQAARSTLGCAGLGGNGQFVRLSALDSVADDRGPWRDTLTDDLDLGLRLITKGGWWIVQDNRAHVAQQGLSDLRSLFRQRTRWAQGNLQAMSLIHQVARTRTIGLGARIEQVLALLTPVWQMIVLASLLLVAWAVIGGQAHVTNVDLPWVVVGGALLSFASIFIGCAVQGWWRGGFVGVCRAILVMLPYAIYTWMMWPVMLRALTRQTIGRGAWAKTAREPI